MSEAIQELEERIEGMDPGDPEHAELTKTLKVCQEMSYLVSEGIVTLREQEGEFCFEANEEPELTLV